tara:strand:- start:1732 stop:2205 length:474 start_codon:yes stop_codon:yes gene_type:complete
MVAPSTKKVEAKVIVQGIIHPTILNREIKNVNVNEGLKDSKNKPIPPAYILKEIVEYINNYNNTKFKSARILNESDIQNYNYQLRCQEIDDFAEDYTTDKLTKDNLLKDICVNGISKTEMRRRCVAILKKHNDWKNVNIKITTQDISSYCARKKIFS